jgi:hypothetical protein
LSPESIQKARERIDQFRAQVVRVRHNLPVKTLCHEKTVTA